MLVTLVAIAAFSIWLVARPALGGQLDAERVARFEKSSQWRDGRFRNRRPRHDAPFFESLGKFAFGGSDVSEPNAPVPVVARSAADYATPPASGLRVTWFGHSTTLVEIDGHRVLTDPTWGARASPFTFAGPTRFYPPPLALADMPLPDVVLISHDHYDHLDMPTVRALAARGARFVVPLGIGAHLESWGISADRITELDWWNAVDIGGLTVTSTPSRHFSGRGVTGQDRTLWSGWAIRGAQHRVYYSGDTALDDTMVEIGQRLGPFDLTMIEIGQYDALWPDVHLGPEQAVRAHQLLRGDVMLPVHWAGFDLALHSWTEPVERTLVAAMAAGVRVATPQPGEMLEPSALGVQRRWWPALPWRTVEQAPAFSTGTAHLMR
ncbi:MAG TPA: MBL fold metallo-hydrolase [Gemmatimonadaceae bacterium]|nr:MBL fold metallo-hydrolase [Gemmatimonadaceae bacterium]